KAGHGAGLQTRALPHKMWRTLFVLVTLCAAILTVAAQSLALFHPHGIDFLHRNSPTSQKYLIETLGGGVALLDYNNDGLLDLFLVNGGRLQDPQKLPADYCRRERHNGTPRSGQNPAAASTMSPQRAVPPKPGMSNERGAPS